MARTQKELQGRPCIALEEAEPDRKQIIVSRSFGQRVEDPRVIGEAAATFATRACEKLRKRGLVASGVWVFAQTDGFRLDLPQHYPSKAIALPQSTADTRAVLESVRYLIRGMLKKGYSYKKCGVGLLDLSRPEDLQPDLFQSPPMGSSAVMDTLDAINRKFGRGTAGFAASGWKAKPAWGMRQKNVSPYFTTKWGDIPTTVC
jgi:DNA polymerase V